MPKKHLLFFPLPLQGHITPILQLADILHRSSDSFSITVIHTRFNAPNPLHYPHFTFRPIDDGLSEADTSGLSVFDLAYLINRRCLEPFTSCLNELFSSGSDDYAALISDPAFHFTRDVAERFGLKRFVLRTSGVANFRIFTMLSMFLEKGYLPMQANGLEDPITELPPLRVKDLPFHNVPDLENFYRFIDALVEESKTSSGIIFNTFQELEGVPIEALRRELQVPIIPVGPFHKYFPSASSSLLKPDGTSIPWLNKQEPKSVIYVSFGSVTAIGKDEFLEIAWGLANSQCPFLWVVRPKSVKGFEWVEALPNGYIDSLNERGHIVKWAPQLDVLEHPSIGAFWTHSGWNSTLEGICEGVPMICTPYFSDQTVNARYVSFDWRVGISLENNGLERGSIERTVRRVLVERDGEEIRQRARDFKEKAERTLRQGGASFEALERLVRDLLSSSRQGETELS